MTGTQGSDVIRGDDGPNELFAGYLGVEDRLEGRGGDDVLWDAFSHVENGDADVLDGGAGDDRITGWEGDDHLLGGDGADRLSDRLGSNVVDGGAGDDAVLGFVDAGSLDGGPGTDLVDYSEDAPGAGVGVTVDLTAGTASRRDRTQTLAGFENVRGSAQADDLRGDDGPNVLEGLTGDDGLDGRGGTDSLDGGAGSDRCTNGETTTGCES